MAGPRPRPRQGGVKSRRGSVKTDAGRVRGASTAGAVRPGRGFPRLVRESAPLHPRELTMADLVFVTATIAVFALVALIAKGVAKL